MCGLTSCRCSKIKVPYVQNGSFGKNAFEIFAI